MVEVLVEVAQSRLKRVMASIFQARGHRFRRFSRAIAASGSLKLS
ncbi:hypothetical protein [Polymorphum gilvum]|nr:hypothetical protein [Polymorphum gilvum]